MAANVPAGSARMQQARGDRILFSTSNDNVMMQQILSTHSPDGREFHVKPIPRIIEDIMHRANAPLPGTILSTTHQKTQAQLDAVDENATHRGLFLEPLAYTINNISSEMYCERSGGGDAQATTLALFNTLSNYPWDVKSVLALAAFALIYYEFRLVAQLYPTTNPLAKSVAHLKQLPDIIMERADSLKPVLEPLGSLIKAVLDLTKCIVEFKYLPSQYISLDNPEMVAATAHIPIAVYWTIRSIVACASIVMNLTGISHEYIALTTEAWELYGLALKVNNIHTHFNKQLSLCHQHIAKMKHDEAYSTLVRLFETPHFDNMKVLKALIYPKDDDQLPLFESSTKRRVSIETLRRKIVLLLISELDISLEELVIFDSMYREAKENPSRPEGHYEIVWLPITDRSIPWNEEKQQKLENLQITMPWLSLHHPSMLDPNVIRYIKDYWHFTKKSIVVVLDQQGKIVNLNALHMMWIWGVNAYPFTGLREKQLWEEESWRIELLAAPCEPMIINEGKYICLYGGDDADWIRSITCIVQEVAHAANIQLEMLYVGISNPREKNRRYKGIINAEKLSHVLPDLTYFWFFWSRVESMWHSKVQTGKSVENDKIMEEIMMMLTFDASRQGWAVISRGTGDMVKAKGDIFKMSYSEYNIWKDDIDKKGFLPALDDFIEALRTPLHCNQFILPGATDSLDMVACADCGCAMEKCTMYRCCND